MSIMETSRIDNVTPLMAVHPTEIIKDEIKARGMTQKELAERMGMKASNVSRMFREKECITPLLAVKLENALDIDSSFWLNAQAAFERDVTAINRRNEKECASIQLERILSSLLNIKELYSRLKIRPSLFVQEKMDALGRIFGMEPDKIPSFQLVYDGDFKKSDNAEIDERNMRTWQALAYVSAMRNKPSCGFKDGNARRAAVEIASAAHSGKIDETTVKEILDRYGISYSFVSKLEKTPVDAYSSWVNGYPAIVTTHRYNDICKLVFNIIHELGHIELHIKPGANIAYVSGSTYTKDKKEEEANRFAEDIIISPADWTEIINTRPKGIGLDSIVSILKRQAKAKDLDFGLVMWRYKYETNVYALRGTTVEKIPHPLRETFNA